MPELKAKILKKIQIYAFEAIEFKASKVQFY